MGTSFSIIYNRFLGRITDDMYVELTPEDTLRDLQNLLIEAIPHFEFPRKDLYNYTIDTKVVNEDELTEDDFILGLVWQDLPEGNDQIQRVIVDNSYFAETLTSEEISILSVLMMINWVQRQVTSIENTRMKYSGPDFKMTSQANHLQKLLTLLSECQRQSIHDQRLYKRRRLVTDETGTVKVYRSNWDVFNWGVYY